MLEQLAIYGTPDDCIKKLKKFKDAGLDLSPATIRNVMSDLEEMGLVSAPHTSAGRIPTPKGYRPWNGGIRP